MESREIKLYKVKELSENQDGVVVVNDMLDSSQKFNDSISVVVDMKTLT